MMRIYNHFLMKPVVDDRVLDKSTVYSSEVTDVLMKALAFSLLAVPDEIDYRAVKIFESDHMHQIFTMPKKKQLPHIVLLHGFGGTAMTYVRLFKSLSEHYQVHALDTFGIGNSSNGGFDEKFTYDEARNYFVNAIQAWRERMGIEEFTMVGHSFGGYIAACYTETYGKRVNRLVLLSPAGTTEKTEEEIQQELKKRADNGWRGKLFMFFAEKIYNMRWKPSKLMGTCIIGQKMLDRVVNDRLKLKDEESLAWRTYFKELSKREASSEAGFYIIFEWPLKPKHTIEAMLERMEYKGPIEFYYGQYDWMDSHGAQRMAQKFDNVSFDLISNAGHQLIFDNGEEVSLKIISKMMRRKAVEQMGMRRMQMSLQSR